VGRATFYAHFPDKEALLVSSITQMLDALRPHLVQENPGGQPTMSVVELFRHTQEYHHYYEALVWGRGIELLYQQGQTHLSQRIAQDLTRLLPAGQQFAVPLPVLSAYVAGVLITLLRWWLEHTMPYSAEQMDVIFHQLVMPSVKAALPATQTTS
jgi:AcrR family transcriptional regulator